MAQSALPPLRVELVADGFSFPVGVTAPPKDPTRLFVIEHTGTIRIIKNGNVLPTPFLDITNDVGWSLENGLLGLAFHPAYESNGRFFVSYNSAADGSLIIQEFKRGSNSDVADHLSGVVLLNIPKPAQNHNGGTLAFSPIDGYLYISVGDGGDGGDPFNQAQNQHLLLGKVLRIDVDSGVLPYAIPPTNPHAATPASGREEIYLWGLRNAWQFGFDRVSGELYIADVGQELVEEVSVIPALNFIYRNLGWNCYEGNLCVSYSSPTGCNCSDLRLVPPVFTYDHPVGCAVIGGRVYRGSAIPELRGTYFLGDACSKKMWSFEYADGVAGNVQIRTDELAAPPPANSLVAFGEDAAGEIHTVYYSGAIGKIVRADDQQPGVSEFGFAYGGCQGALELHVNHAPLIGTPNFHIYAVNAPPQSTGVVFFSDRYASGEDPFGFGVGLFVDLLHATEVIGAPLISDEFGIASHWFDLPGMTQLVGRTYFAQGLFYWNPPCNEVMPFGFGSTPALSLTIGE